MTPTPIDLGLTASDVSTSFAGQLIGYCAGATAIGLGIYCVWMGVGMYRAHLTGRHNAATRHYKRRWSGH